MGSLHDKQKAYHILEEFFYILVPISAVENRPIHHKIVMKMA